MPIIEDKRVLPYSPAQLYAIVNDVTRYPEFIPYCKSAQILEKGQDQVQAKLDFGKGHLHYALTTQNTCVPDERITMDLVHGPFKHLQGVWMFQSIEGGSVLIIQIEFTFANRWLAMLLDPVLHRASAAILNAIEDRAKGLYG